MGAVDPASNLEQQLAFGLACARDGVSIGWLSDDGAVATGQPEKTWLTARMAHVFALGSVLGLPGCADVAQVAVGSLTTRLADPAHGGWFSGSVASDDGEAKACYVHAQVVVGAAGAARAGVPGADALLVDALAQLERFWLPREGVYADELSRDWSITDAGRSTTANMHALEALLAVAENPPRGVDPTISLDRAESIATLVVDRMARANHWRIPQRFDSSGRADLLSGSEHPDDPFDPFGNVVGLDFEWARLILGLRELLGEHAPDWMLDAARHLYSCGASDGWDTAEGGFVYTTDWDGSPLVDLRMHWVLAEAISAAAALAAATGESSYLADCDRWWQFAADHVIDRGNGSWRHELDTQNRPSEKVWVGRPDLYHSVHAALFASGAQGATPFSAAL